MVQASKSLKIVNLSYESRIEGRVKLTIPFKIRFEKSAPFFAEDVVTENISKTGLCIMTKQAIPVNTKVYLETPNHKFRALALVVRSTKNKAGLRILASKGSWLVK
jgi:hypothetical protein